MTVQETREVKTIGNRTAVALSDATEICVSNDREYSVAGEFLQTCKDLEQHILKFIHPVVAAAHKAHKEAKAKENSLMLPLKEARSIVGEKMGQYQAMLEQQRRAEEERIQQEQQRILNVEAAEQARELSAQGEHRKALQAAVRVPEASPVHMQSTAPKVAGTSRRSVWKWEVTDKTKLPIHFLMPNDVAISSVVRSQKEKTDIPGVRVWEEHKVV